MNLLKAVTLGIQANIKSYGEVIKTSEPSQKEEMQVRQLKVQTWECWKRADLALPEKKTYK